MLTLCANWQAQTRHCHDIPPKMSNSPRTKATPTNKHRGLMRIVPVVGTDRRNRLDALIFDAVLTTLPVK